ncbi:MULTISPECIES: TonB-dependent siderophore receptor [unclassified Pseudomonas]|uniref:TonB-dependent siderophore receptor n=1 Tax=unclassified Pseudomonas TaxID=196821 RepID=UPI00053433D4|nr:MULTISPECIES: TonB-dependent receptor [unclassified Pseudomonas]RAS31620.1 outer membrane receptor for ferric coprogen and ferric-rhodotorulic acid [Pseudomonas sp. URMO17WK12:I7]SMF07978.1 outer-membrane receptor for ferric coprogen and ferric-rhodotorulic acid [Pseudomonas sp. URMO17WK12:I5]
MTITTVSPLARAVRRKTLAILPSSLLACALAASMAAQAEPVALDIPSQGLVGALNTLAKQANLQLLYSPDAVHNTPAPAVKGNMEPEQALRLLLRDSGLTYQLDGHTITLSGPADASALNLGPVNISGRQFDATTEDSGSYTSNAVTIGKGTHRLKDIPQSVSVVTRKAMDDQRLDTLDQVLEKTTGITTYQSPSGGKYIYSRGFEVETIQYDGVPLDRRYYGIGSSFTSDTLLYDRVEVLRGANGLLQGSGNPGAAINLVRKRPKAEPSLSITASAGSWDTYRQTIDASGPLTTDGRLRGRLVAGHEDRDYFYDTADSRKNVLYGILEYDLSDSTTVAAGASVEDLHSTPYFGGLPRNKDGSAVNVSRSTFTGADWNKWNNKQTTYFADITHDFNEDWRLKASGSYIRETNDIFYSFGRGAVDPATGNGMQSRAYLYDFENINQGADINLTGKWRAFGHEHEIVVGANASDLRTDDLQGGLLNLGPMNIYDPVSPREPTLDEMLGTTYAGVSKAKIRQNGVYSVLRYKLTDPLTLVLGARVSNYKYDYELTRFTTASPDPSHAKESGEVTPYGGLIYALNDQWSAYVSYADIFKPQTELTEDLAPLKPIEGSNYEIGLKGELLDGRVNTSFAVFRVDQENRAQYDYNSVCGQDGETNCYVAGGKVRAEGFDAEISGEVLAGLQLFAGYTYTSTKFLNDPGDGSTASGATFNSYTPRHLLRFWGDYNLPGELNQWTVGAGANIQSKNHNTNQGGTNGIDKIEQAGYAIWNARVAYQINQNFSVALNGNNLFDKKYYSSIGWLNASNVYGEPRNYTVTLRADF